MTNILEKTSGNDRKRRRGNEPKIKGFQRRFEDSLEDGTKQRNWEG